MVWGYHASVVGCRQVVDVCVKGVASSAIGTATCQGPGNDGQRVGVDVFPCDLQSDKLDEANIHQCSARPWTYERNLMLIESEAGFHGELYCTPAQFAAQRQHCSGLPGW